MSTLGSALKNIADGEKYCSYAILRGKLSPDDTSALDAAITKGIPSYAIAKILRTEGFKIAHTSIQDHRDFKCKCPKGEK